MESKKLLLLLVILISINLISAGCSDGQININSASLTDLDQLYGIGLAKAQSIIDARPFETLDDLINVLGIGEITLNKIKEQNLACVEKEESKTTEEPNEKIPEEKPDVIKIIGNKTPKEKKIVKQVIKINPKVINTENSTSELIKEEYALIGLGFFSMLIIFLLVLKLKPKDKNEFD